MLAAFFRLPRLSKGSKGKRPQATLNLRWDESKHPRGQADNAGQFASTPGASGSQATATAQAGGPRFTQATGAAAKLGQKRTLARVPSRLKFGVEDIVFTEQEKAQSPYTWRVKHVAAAVNLFEPMAMWVLDDAMVEALRRECVANDDQVGLMLVDLHRDRRASFTRRQREEARGTVMAMLKQAAARADGNGHNGSNGSNGNGVRKAVTLEEALLPPAAPRTGAVQRFLGWLRKSQMSLFDEDLHPRHPAGSEQGGQFAPKAGGPRISAAPEADVAEPGPNEREDLYRQAVRQRWPRIPDALQGLEQLKKLWRYRKSRWGAHSAAQAATLLKISRREAEQLLRGPIASDLGWGYSNTAGLDQAYLDENREPKWPTWEDGWRREQALDREDLDEEESRALEALRAEAATTPGGVIMRGALMGAGFSREDATRLLDLLEARGAIVPTDDGGLAWTLAGDGEAEAAPSPYAGERAELQAKLDAVNAKREKHAASAQAFADANYAPGLQADTGGIRSRSQKRKQQMFDRNSRDAQEGLELLAEAEDLEQQIDAIDSGRREAHDAEKAKRKAMTPLKRLEEAVYAATVAEAPKGSPEWNEYLAALADAQHKQMNKQVKAAVERGLKRAKKAGPVRKSIVAFRHHEEVVA